MKHISNASRIFLLALGACSSASSALDEAPTSGNERTGSVASGLAPEGADGASGLAPEGGDGASPVTLHPLGWLPDSPATMAAHKLTGAPPPAAGLPSSLDMRNKIAPPGDQGGENSCVAWAVGYATKTLQEAEEEGWSVSTNKHVFSPSWIYNQINGGMNVPTSFSNALSLNRLLKKAA